MIQLHKEYIQNSRNTSSKTNQPSNIISLILSPNETNIRDAQNNYHNKTIHTRDRHQTKIDPHIYETTTRIDTIKQHTIEFRKTLSQNTKGIPHAAVAIYINVQLKEKGLIRNNWLSMHSPI